MRGNGFRKETAIFSNEEKYLIKYTTMKTGFLLARKRSELIAKTGEECESESFLPLWRLFREASLSGGACRDIVEKHVMCKLDGTDIKFLYGVNTETRKLIKRSSRAGDLKKKFKVNEMSSISTLEVAWEHYAWGTPMPEYFVLGVPEYFVLKTDEPRFCSRVAQTNKLELLEWIREEKKCEWDEYTIKAAVIQGNLEIVKYCVANECPMYEDACVQAAKNGHLEVLKYLHEEVKAPWDEYIAFLAAQKGHLHILEYLVERKFDMFNDYTCRCAAKYGHLDCLKYLHETAKAPWDYEAVQEAHENNQTECVQYLLDNNCPLPPGWRYENGTLHTR